MKRQFIHSNYFNPHSVVLLFEKGGGGTSWSVRDYSREGSVQVPYASEFNESLTTILQKPHTSFAAKMVSVSDTAFWHQQTTACNHGLGLLPTNYSDDVLQQGESREETRKFGLMDEQVLWAMPKATKAGDMKRMLHSPNSEDWVTWTAFRLANTFAADDWWPYLVDLACRNNPAIQLPEGGEVTPSISFWKCVPSPKAYEEASRRRMAASGTAGWVERSGKAGPVEGQSEIDISLHGKAVTVFIEAKLGSDVSERTSYDPERNQIVRNIDCLLDDARSTSPFFWMMVRDAGEQSMYTQLLGKYRAQPDALCRLLPHRHPETLRQVASQTALILWRDFIQVFAARIPGEGPAVELNRELRRRVRSNS